MKKYFALKVLFLFLSLTLTTTKLFAQDNGSISGTVSDADNGSVLQAVSIQLLTQSDSSIVTGGETDEAGKFTLENIKSGKYKLVANYVGYKKVVVSNINVAGGPVTLAPILMTTGTITEQIEVNAEKPFIEFQPDKKVFNVEQGMTTTGGSVIDILKNIPGVTVDQDNNITFRGGSNVKVNIDGRPFGLNSSNLSTILEQIPADKVSSVELLTNPTAKFDAEGSSGIINIVMKKNENNEELNGVNGSLSLNAGNKDKYNGSFSLSTRTKNYTLSGSYDARFFNMEMTGYNNRTTFANSTTSNILSLNTNQNRMRSNLVRAGIDWIINPQQNFSLNATYSNRKRNGGGENLTDIYENSVLTTDYINRSYNNNDGTTYGVSANYLLKFANPKQTLSSDFSYTKSDGDRTSTTLIDYYLPVNTPQGRNNQFSNEKEDEVNFQIDFTTPFNESRKLETGVKSIFRKTYEDSRSEDFDYNTNTFITGANSNIFDYQELISSAYIAYQDKIGNFGYQVGLRGEQTNTKGNQITANSNFTKSYFSLFPNASVSQKLGETEEMQLSYSRRVRRPDLDNLNPFLNTSDPLNYQSGNPDLMPEYTNSFELNFIKYFTSAIITPSIYFRQTNDKISRVRLQYDSLITLNTQQNFASSKSYGFELTMNANPIKAWMINGTVGYSKTVNDATNLTGQTNEAYSWNGRMFTTLALPDDFGVQFTYLYSGKNISAQGEIDPFSSADISVKKDFMDKKLSLSLRVSDLFDSQKFHGTISDINFYDEFERRRDSRSVFLSLTYKFGTESKQDKRKKRDTNNTEPIEVPDGF